MNNGKYGRKEEMNSSVLSTQDSNNQKKKDSFTNKSKYEDKYKEKRNYTEYTRIEEARKQQQVLQQQQIPQQQQIKKDPSVKKRETSKENFLNPKEMRTSQSKEKNNWIKPTQKPAFVDTRSFGTEKELKYFEKPGATFTSGYYKKK